MKIDAHMHVVGRHFRPAFDNRAIIEAADALGIDQLCCSVPITRGAPTPDQVRECNDDVLAAMREFPDRILGYCFLNPGYSREAIEEMNRCIEGEGMMGVKLYNQYFASEPVVFPIVERAIELGVPILHHAGKVCDAATRAAQPRLSNGEHLAELGRRYPEAMLILGHIGGGGDWEWAVKAVRGVPNVYADTSGSVVDMGMIELAAKELGAERLLFATDMTMEGGVGKILDADLTDEQREQIFYKNMKAILERRTR